MKRGYICYVHVNDYYLASIRLYPYLSYSLICILGFVISDLLTLASLLQSINESRSSVNLVE